MSSNFTVIYDACVIYLAPLRDSSCCGSGSPYSDGRRFNSAF